MWFYKECNVNLKELNLTKFQRQKIETGFMKIKEKVRQLTNTDGYVSSMDDSEEYENIVTVEDEMCSTEDEEFSSERQSDRDFIVVDMTEESSASFDPEEESSETDESSDSLEDLVKQAEAYMEKQLKVAASNHHNTIELLEKKIEVLKQENLYKQKKIEQLQAKFQRLNERSNYQKVKEKFKALHSAL